jgi:hypothetical protein
MMKRAELEDLLGVRRRGNIERYRHMIPALVALYKVGLTVRELEAMFPVSRQWIRNRLKEEGVEFRAAHGRPLKDRENDVTKVIRVLKKHGIDLKDLPAPAGKARVEKGGRR